MRGIAADRRASGVRRALGAAAVIALTVCSTALFTAIGAGPADAATECNVQPGGPYTGQPWQQSRLNFRSVWGITRGVGVKVAVLDSGLDIGPNVGATGQAAQIPHIQMHAVRGANVIPSPGKGQLKPTGTVDCYKHGTEVASIIGASKTDSAFVGVAPDATILPIKITDQNANSISQSTTSAAIRLAVAAGAQIINISAAADGKRQDMGELEAAVKYADSRGVVIVASAGNDGSTSNQPGFPAAFSPYYANVIAVSASDANDSIGSFSESGNYVTVAAPGVNVWVPAPDGYLKESGTSYAAPYVTGTVALMLAAHPSLVGHPGLVRNRLIATADPPPVRTPNPSYGYGVVDPYLAVTSIRNDAAVPTAAPARAAGAQPLSASVHDRGLENIALAVGLSLLGLAVLVTVGTAVYRAGNRQRSGGRAAL